MNRINKLLLSGILATGPVLTSCYKIDYVAGPSSPYPQTTEWHHIGILGLVEFSEPVRLDMICPGGFARVHNEISFVNGLVPIGLNFFGLGWVYQPHTVKVYCKSGQAFELGLDSDGYATSALRLPDVEPTAEVLTEGVLLVE